MANSNCFAPVKVTESVRLNLVPDHELKNKSLDLLPGGFPKLFGFKEHSGKIAAKYLN